MTSAQQQLASLAGKPDDDIDFAEAALDISRLFQQRVAAQESLQRLDLLAAAARARVSEDADLLRQVADLNAFFFDELGFTGNQQDFYDPRNSFLDQVLERRLGIPITLSMVYVEIAARLGMPAHGVSFPAHFLVRIGRGSTALMIDAYAGGAALGEDDLDRRLAEVYGEGVLSIRANPSLLRPAGKREILVRMLRNLTGVYRARGDSANLLEALTAVLNVSPDLPDELYQRGLLYRELGYSPAALEDLTRFTQVSDDAEEIAAASEIIDALSAQPVKLH
ncbi:MAG: transglutaminase-like domain-containing protein [Thiohalocapsa sp.]|nr:transglutaminase-like domain-containing protein [Thiohalocapsa sp.]MCF7989116.1 transglutaminase-like domain-containing protein [Thiohalocapsa sp.]